MRLVSTQKMRRAEDMIGVMARQAMNGHEVISGPAHLRVEIYQHTPRSWTEKKRGATKWITGRPDADNVLKLVADAMNGIAYRDDAQIACATIVRGYDDATPERVRVTVEAMA
jgi:Holliday junction resolvase RusA-like endonuclease